MRDEVVRGRKSVVKFPDLFRSQSELPRVKCVFICIMSDGMTERGGERERGRGGAVE